MKIYSFFAISFVIRRRCHSSVSTISSACK